MCFPYVYFNLSNPKNTDLKSIDIRSLVETGALLRRLPKHIAFQLDFEEPEIGKVCTADGKMHKVPHVSTLMIEFENRFCFTGALVVGDEPLLRTVPMEDKGCIGLSRITEIGY